MREIKFRANIKNTPIIIDGFALYDSGMIGMHPETLASQLPAAYSHCSDSDYLLHGEDQICEVMPGDEWIFIEGKDIEIMQFTGLKDKNGKEIYEGDIVECYDHPYNEDSGIFEIGFSHGAFSCKNSSLLLRDFGTAWTEVIGNIYETPELLTKNKEENGK